MKKSNIYNRLRNYDIKDTISFRLSNNETIYIDISSNAFDKLCGLSLDYNGNFAGDRKELFLEKRDDIYNSSVLEKFSLVKGTNYFSSSKLLFVAFNPDLGDYYADFIFRLPTEAFVSLRVSLVDDFDNYHDEKSTKVNLNTIFIIKDFNDLLCNKTYSILVSSSSKQNNSIYNSRSSKVSKEFTRRLCKAYGVKKDDGKKSRIKAQSSLYCLKLRH